MIPAYGSTRVVLFTRKSAYKIARIRVLGVLVYLVLIPFFRKRRERFFAKYGPDLAGAILKYILAGVRGNRREFAYWQEYRDKRVMPTLHCYLGGLVVVQPIGLPFMGKGCQVKELAHEDPEYLRNLDILNPEQYCRDPHTDNVLLVDYGKRVTVEALGRTCS